MHNASHMCKVQRLLWLLYYSTRGVIRRAGCC